MDTKTEKDDSKETLIDILTGCTDETKEEELSKIFSTHQFAKEITEKTIDPQKLSIDELEQAIPTVQNNHQNCVEYAIQNGCKQNFK